MGSFKKKSDDLHELINHLNEDRAFILAKLDQGDWPDLRHELAALERDLSRLLSLAAERLQSDA
ncbi:hypothetical protein [Prochlorococcus marinus]|uniref:Uncharacterized protein n=1 Tax=Prochlorococcus marinus (strain MIT 9211) TaxID=93059 RepID=A9BEC2_PROM4|nr:hypothetical protein [Prochlorococcus marinus]ABX08432.1 Hypothetical protein P9211_05011 [Prochlorococcus marinus str. MIT 9211]